MARKWLSYLLGLSWLLVSLWVPIMSQAASATAPQTPSSPPSSILGLNLAGGFRQQPQDVNQVAGQTVTLAAKGTRNALEAATSLLNSRKYVWWESTDGGQTYQQVGSNSATYSFTAPNVTTSTPLYFQVQYKSSGISAFSDYWSRIAQVTVEPSRIAATGIKVSADTTTLSNSESTAVHADLSPSNSTDQVTWKSSDSTLASVDDYGNVDAADASSDTSGKADDHGIVTITGTVNGISDHVDIMVGSLQDETVMEGTPATFQLPTLPADVTVSNWYRVKDGKSTALNSQATSYTIKSPTNADDDGTGYYATLTYTVNGKPQTVTTNAALLTVTKGGSLTLRAVPNFNFGSVSLKALASGTQLKTTSATTNGTAVDGNDQYQMAVSDQRTVGNAWTLSASLAPFGTSAYGGASITNAQLTLVDASQNLSVTLPADNQQQTIASQNGYHSQSYDVTASYLTVGHNPLVSAGTYQSIINWTLGVVPNQ
ncbi:WxL domain-containing protein [Lactiplantibacillus mudanjiangensis]|uniref:Cell surface protein [Lactobacillus pentosus] n=1 Tax=Lactiplantibacillus mudanjiangensis TaxID=1296538 RepID=A0A660EA65_9LACO|nr:WxL domain-containing protein [Lactiplantibacillus mudanjiangensis]VDG23857.1 cell surface protein [Lactobacillus pentosus] [Lactiplantibacillus mudanjiangensis]VDG30084.1 cell surface protein [Lactobacillus pentosus] [Lactiplantibacillus mudanjiangensis]